jgi:hemoglobin
MTRETLYDQVGGAPAIADIVDRFYGRLRVDAQVRHLFNAERAERVMDAQRQYFSAMLGGPSERFGTDLAAELAAAHRDVDIRDEHVALVLDHLRAALLESGASEALTDRVVAVAMRLWWARRWN